MEIDAPFVVDVNVGDAVLVDHYRVQKKPVHLDHIHRKWAHLSGRSYLKKVQRSADDRRSGGRA